MFVKSIQSQIYHTGIVENAFTKVFQWNTKEASFDASFLFGIFAKIAKIKLKVSIIAKNKI